MACCQTTDATHPPPALAEGITQQGDGAPQRQGQPKTGVEIIRTDTLFFTSQKLDELIGDRELQAQEGFIQPAPGQAREQIQTGAMRQLRIRPQTATNCGGDGSGRPQGGQSATHTGIDPLQISPVISCDGVTQHSGVTIQPLPW